MSEIRDYPSRMDDPASKRMGTFSYLPEMDKGALRAQIEHLVATGLIPAIEHIEPARAAKTYWYMWKLPMFGMADPEAILDEVRACRKANPEHHVRLIGYDNKRQTQGVAFIAYRGG
jgi:ribulose-bisphosphate carboxylase small chain